MQPPKVPAAIHAGLSLNWHAQHSMAPKAFKPPRIAHEALSTETPTPMGVKISVVAVPRLVWPFPGPSHHRGVR